MFRLKSKLIVNHYNSSFRYWLFGLISSIMLIFSFCIGSYFRPYSAHNNPHMSEEVISLGISDYSSSDSIDTSAINDKFNSYLSRIDFDFSPYAYSNTYVIDDDGFYVSSTLVVFADSDFNLQNLGSISQDPLYADDKLPIIVSSKDYICDNLKTNLEEVYGYNGSIKKIKRTDEREFGVTPFLNAGGVDNNYVILPSSWLKTNTKNSETVLIRSYNLNSPLSDKEVDYIYSFWSSSFINDHPFDYFLYPSSGITVFDSLFNGIALLAEGLSIIVSLSIIIGLSLSLYQHQAEDKMTVTNQRYLGLNLHTYLVNRELGTGGMYILGSLTSIVIYSLFMVIFKKVKKFSFFFSYKGWLILIAFMIFDVLLELLFSLMIWNKSQKRREE